MPTHAEKRVLPHSPEQLYALVADVERYPEFLPWCLAVRVRQRDMAPPEAGGGGTLVSDMAIGFKVFREQFTTRVVCTPASDQAPGRIDVSYEDGPFKHLNNHWVFEATDDGHCEIDFYVDFEFRSAILQKAIGVVFNEAVQKMVNAFETRARALYDAN